MGTTTYEFGEFNGRPSRPKRMLYLFVWLLIVFGVPFTSVYFWTLYYEHRNEIESLAAALTMVVCISPAEGLWFWRGLVFIAFASNKNLVLSKLALFAISIGREWSRAEWEEDQDYWFLIDQHK